MKIDEGPSLDARIRRDTAREASQERALAKVESAATVVQDGHEGTGPAIWDLLIAELLEQSQKNPRPAEAMALRARVAEDGRARDAFGVSKYGRRLRAYDGRDSLVDAIQELLDASVYFRKAVYEGRACEGLYEQALRLTIATRAQIEADAAQGIGGPIAAPPSGMPSSAPLGRVAYDAYRARRGGVAYDGTAIPEWDALRPEIREAWSDAAAAVVGARLTPHAGALDLDAARKAAREAQERADKATPGPWRKGAVQKDRVFCPFDGALEGPNGERVILRMNEHFPHEADSAFIAAARTDVPELAALVLAMAEEIERLAAERDAALARVKRFEAFLPEVGYDPNDV